VIVRHEEEIGVDKDWRGIGFLRARKHARTVKVREKLPVDFEQLVQERVPVAAGDSGEIETLPDGSLSIPLYEEELVVTKRTLLRERVIVRKQIVHGPSGSKRSCAASRSRSMQTTKSK
jgi:uncharacterized protein (TIGR02271 family)